MLSCLAISGNVWGGSMSSDVLAVHNYDPKKTNIQFFEKKTYSFLEVSIGDIQEHPLGVYLGKAYCISILFKLNAIIFLLN